MFNVMSPIDVEMYSLDGSVNGKKMSINEYKS